MRRFFIAMLAVACTSGICTGQQTDAGRRDVPLLPRTNGVEPDRLLHSGSRWEVGGKDVTERRGRAALISDDQVHDDSKSPSLTFIGAKTETSKARGDLEKSPATAELLKGYLIQEFEPSNPLIRRAGFLTDGKPTIYAEMPDGRTLFRLDEFPGPEKMVHTLRTALQVSEGVRKPDPDYKPAADSGLTVPIKPQVNADVTLGPVASILSHLVAALIGAVLGVGVILGGGVLSRKILASVIAAELAKVPPPSVTPPAATPKA